MSEVLLSARNLTKKFGGLAAVNDVSVDLWRERIHVVIAPNGAGKSTLLRALAGLMPHTGTVHLLGRELADWPRRDQAVSSTPLTLPTIPLV